MNVQLRQLLAVLSVLLILAVAPAGAFERIRCPDDRGALETFCADTIPQRLQEARNALESVRQLAYDGNVIFVPLKCRNVGIDDLERCRTHYQSQGRLRVGENDSIGVQQLIIDRDLNILFAVVRWDEFSRVLAQAPTRLDEYRAKHLRIADSWIANRQDEVARWEDAKTSCCDFKLDQMRRQDSGYWSFDPSIRPPGCSPRPSTREWAERRARGFATDQERQCDTWRQWARDNQPQLLLE